MKKYVEIEQYIIDLENIAYIAKRQKPDSSLKDGTKTMIIFVGGDFLSVDGKYYDKLKEMISPLHFSNEFELDGVNDFPGDNMIEE